MTQALTKCLVFGLIVTASPCALAEPRCPSVVDGAHALDDVAPDVRLSFLRTRLRDDARHAQTWSTGWGLFGSAVASGGVMLAAASDGTHDRILWLARGLPAAGFPLLTLVDPIAVASDGRALEAATRESPTSFEEACTQLHFAERMLEDDAANEKRKRGLVSHVLGLLANLASSTVIIVGTGDVLAGIGNGVSGLAVSEFAIWTLPTGSIDALARYRSGSLVASAPPSAVAMTLSPRGAGLTITW